MDDFFAAHKWADHDEQAGGLAGPYLHVILPIQLDGEARAYAAAHRALLEPLPLSATGPDWLHLTVQGVYHLTTEEQEEQAARALRERLIWIGQFPVQIGPTLAGGAGVTAAVYPETAIEKLYRETRAALQSVPGITLRPAEPRFWPHVSLGYATAAFDSGPLAAELRDLRPPRADITIDRVHLVAMHQDPASPAPYTWELLDEFELATVSPSPRLNGPAGTSAGLARALLRYADRIPVSDAWWREDWDLRIARSVLDIPAGGRATHADQWAAPDVLKVVSAGEGHITGGGARYVIHANGSTRPAYIADVADDVMTVVSADGAPAPDPALHQRVRDAISQWLDPRPAL